MSQTKLFRLAVSIEEIIINFTEALNLTVAFLLELLVVVVYFCVSLAIPGSRFLRYGSAVVTTGIVMALWTVFAAPRSQRRLTAPSLYFFKILVFGGAAAILLIAHWVHLAILLTLISISSLALEIAQSKQ